MGTLGVATCYQYVKFLFLQAFIDYFLLIFIDNDNAQNFGSWIKKSLKRYFDENMILHNIIYRFETKLKPVLNAKTEIT